MSKSDFVPLLLHNYKPSLTSVSSYVSIKYDGWRMIWLPNKTSPKGGEFVTRQGTLFEAPLNLYIECSRLSPTDILDGEMWKGYGYQSSDISSLDSDDKLQYMIFDCPSHSGIYADRYKYLQNLFGKYVTMTKLYLVEQQLVTSNDLLFHELMNAEVRRGGEGIVIRNPCAYYDYGQRTNNVLKLKPFDIITATIVGYNDCDDLTSYTKSLICTTTESENGNLVEFKVTFKNVNPPSIGSEIRVRHSCYTTKGLPKFPVYLGVLGGQLKSHLLPENHIENIKIPNPIQSQSQSQSENQSEPQLSEVPKLKLKKFKTIVNLEEIIATPLLSEPKVVIESEPKVLTSFVKSIRGNNLGEYTEQTVLEMKGQMCPLNWLILKSKSGGTYKITMSKMGQIYCDCPAWKYQSLHPKNRTCKHCIMLQ